ncbi:hypothetical protein DLM75_20345 [Leptospira stimsonii]|uniref:Uncharacterized protein n=2 Tax=Leptospira stimsonii TaxID=2202203 RepID=A0A396YXA3_9LEPT|nr:hypothetical protein DLM75_20345 [Leptospira stimsonii]
MNEKSVLRLLKLRTSSLSYLIPLFYLCHYFLGIAEGQLMKHFMNVKAVEINESDLDEHERILGIKLSQLEREAILKYSGYRTALRFVSSRNIFLKTPVDFGSIIPEKE